MTPETPETPEIENTTENVESKVPVSVYSPPFKIEPVYYNNKTFHVFRDDHLVGGSKQRGMVPLLENSDNQEFVYGGPNNGYAQIALAYAAQLTRKKCTLFVARTRREHPFTTKARKKGAKVIFVKKGFLNVVQSAAENYVRKTPGAELVPFGGGSDEFKKYMIKNIQNALPPNLIENPPKRI